MHEYDWNLGLKAVLVLALAVAVLGLDRPPSKQLAVATPIARSAPTITSGPAFMDVDLASQVEQIKIDEYLAAEHQRQLDEFYAGVQAELDRLAEMARLQKAAAPRSSAPATAAPANYDPGDGSVWDQLAQCESGGNWAINTGNGYSGGLQFHPQTWLSWGGGQYAPYAYMATREQQIEIAQGHAWSNWPACARKLGLL